MYLIYQQSIESRCQLHVPGLRYYEALNFCTHAFRISVFCVIPTTLVRLDYFRVIISLLLFKIDQGYFPVRCGLVR
jgi:hypothetical protein